jgi:hypothetical protein
MKQIMKQLDLIVGSKTFNRTVVLAFFTMSLIYNAQEKCSTAILFAIYETRKISK